MEVDAITWLWLIGGVVLMLSEVFVPGLVVIFLGLSAVLVAGGRWLGLIEGILNSFTCWFVFSLATILGIRGLVSRLMPGSIYRRSPDEDKEAVGRLVEVIDEIGGDHDRGRIRFRGTTWKARTEFGRIFPGHTAKIIGREDLVWIVQPVDKQNHSKLDSLVDKVEKDHPIQRKKRSRFFKQPQKGKM